MLEHHKSCPWLIFQSGAVLFLWVVPCSSMIWFMDFDDLFLYDQTEPLRPSLRALSQQSTSSFFPYDATEPLEIPLRALSQQSTSGFFLHDQTEALQPPLRALSQQSSHEFFLHDAAKHFIHFLGHSKLVHKSCRLRCKFHALRHHSDFIPPNRYSKIHLSRHRSSRIGRINISHGSCDSDPDVSAVCLKTSPRHRSGGFF